MKSKGEVADYLQKVSLFSRCSKKDLGAIAKLTEIEQYEPGATIVAEGAPGERWLYVVLEGHAIVRRNGRRTGSSGPATISENWRSSTPRPATPTSKPTSRPRSPGWAWARSRSMLARLARRSTNGCSPGSPAACATPTAAPWSSCPRQECESEGFESPFDTRESGHRQAR